MTIFTALKRDHRHIQALLREIPKGLKGDKTPAEDLDDAAVEFLTERRLSEPPHKDRRYKAAKVGLGYHASV